MRTVLSIICLLGVVVLLGSCSGSGSGGGSGSIPRASWEFKNDNIICNNVTRSWIQYKGTTTPVHYCEWNCAYNGGSNTARFVRKVITLDTSQTPTAITEATTLGTCRK